jgi:hypothetical protein
MEQDRGAPSDRPKTNTVPAAKDAQATPIVCERTRQRGSDSEKRFAACTEPAQRRRRDSRDRREDLRQSGYRHRDDSYPHKREPRANWVWPGTRADL